MTEYTTSSQAYRDFMSSRDRTAYWVQSHSSVQDDFYSPSVPPSVFDGLVPSRPPSEADSTNSTPPKMVLRYNDGRPDIPIPHPNYGRSGSGRHPDMARSRTLSYNHSHNRPRTGSSPSIPRSHPNAPEEIRILPSFGHTPTASSSRPSHSRSKSVPRRDNFDQQHDHEVPFMPPPHLQTQSPYHGSRPMSSQGISPTHQVTFAPPAQPSQPWHPRQPHKGVPAIVYAPSHNAQRPNYSPPAMFHHPPQTGPNGVMYSHSAPVPGQYPPQYAGQFSSRQRVNSEVGPGPDRSRFGRSTRRTANPAAGSAESLHGRSEKSGSTYYVLPQHGQKVHVIVSLFESSILVPRWLTAFSSRRLVLNIQ